MKIVKILSLVLFIGIQCCFSQTNSKPKVVNIKEFNWKVTIPKNFALIDGKEWDKVEKRGEKAIEDTFGEGIINQATTLFAYKNGQFNIFEANWQPFDSKLDGDYLETYSEVNKMIYQTFEAQMPKAKLDSISSTQKISGLKFRRFDITINLPNGMILKIIGFSRLFDKKEFTVNITFIDEKIGEKMLDAFQKSRFR